jgi:serine/threonine-protein kinase
MTMSGHRLTPARLQEIQSCFEQALDLEPADRESFLSGVTVRDPDLATRVRGLLKAHESTGALLERPALEGWMAAIEPGEDPLVGSRIGDYRVEARIGAGGMGTVYRAVRADEQYQTRVAIKFLRHHAAGEGALRRFRDERQILANLHHPGIAVLLDGGVTADGQQYFVMEHLEGEPITRWSDARALPVPARLALFEQVCAAVHYAHQSLVVHRDLKPGNILVTADGTVKLLDFGIAKLLPADGDDSTVTQAGGRAYTPDYASPEQLLGRQVGTRSDVYSLGVVLFELLTGKRPFELAGKSAGEAERLVVDVPPPRPSSVIADARARSNVVGDLDAIVLKALAKEPERRYGSVEELAADIRRHLDRHPVGARPEGIGYRLGKLVRRRRVETALVAVALLSLIAGAVLAAMQARRAILERERATEVQAFLTTMLGAANPAAFGKDVQVRTVLDSAAVRAEALADRPAIEVNVREIIGGTYLSLGEFAQAEAQFRRELAIAEGLSPGGSRAVAAALARVSAALEYQGRYREADSVLARSVPLFARFGYSSPQSRADQLDARGRILTRLGRMAEAETLLTEALAIQRAIRPVNDSAVGYAYANLGMVRSELGRNLSAESLLVQAVASAKRAHGEEHPLVAAVMSPLATVQERAGAMDRADSTFRATLAMRRKLLGPEHPEYAWTMFNYADHLLLAGKNAEAATWSRQVLALRGTSFGDSHPAVSTSMSILGRALGRMDSLAEGERWLRESWTVRRAVFPEGHFLIASAESILGEHLILAKRYEEAERHLLAGEKGLVEARGESAPIVADARKRLVKLYEAWGKPDQAAQWKARL